MVEEGGKGESSSPVRQGQCRLVDHRHLRGLARDSEPLAPRRCVVLVWRRLTRFVALLGVAVQLFLRVGQLTGA